MFHFTVFVFFVLFIGCIVGLAVIGIMWKQKSNFVPTTPVVVSDVDRSSLDIQSDIVQDIVQDIVRTCPEDMLLFKRRKPGINSAHERSLLQVPCGFRHTSSSVGL